MKVYSHGIYPVVEEPQFQSLRDGTTLIFGGIISISVDHPYGI